MYRVLPAPSDQSGALTENGIRAGYLHRNVLGLFNHAPDGGEYRWHEGNIECFDRESYAWEAL